MSAVTELSHRTAEAVTIGDLTLYCDEFRASAAVVYSEQPTVSGDTVITNCCRRATRITFSGKCYDPEAPLSFLAGINDISTASDTYTIHYRGEVFSDCRVQSFSADDKGGDFFFVSITLITSEPIAPEEEPS